MRCQPLPPDPFDCRQFQAQLDAVLDARENPDHHPDLCAHAQHCPTCAQWLHAQTAILAAIPTIAPAALNESLTSQPDFALSVLQIVQVQQQNHLRARRWRIAGLAMAAGLLVAVLNFHVPEAGSQLAAPHSHSASPTTAPIAQLVDFADQLEAKQMVLVDGFAQGLRPVTSSVNIALNSLLHTLPGGEIPQHLL